MPRRFMVGIVVCMLAGAAVPASAAQPKTRLISKTSDGTPASGGPSRGPAISGKGRFVAFSSDADNLGGDPSYENIFVHDRKSGRTTLISKTSAGVPADGDSVEPSIDGSGRFVAFTSFADNLGGVPGHADVFLHDRKTGRTRLVSKTSSGVPGDGSSENPVISAGGRYVAFQTIAANLGADSGNQILVHDRKTGKTRLVSKTSKGVKGNGSSRNAAISGSGRYIVFRTNAKNLGGTDDGDQVVVHDRTTRKTRVISKTKKGVKGKDHSDDPNISPNGRYVVFVTAARNLGANDEDQVVLHDRATGRSKVVSRAKNGAKSVGGDGRDPSLSADGRWVLFESNATNLPRKGAVGNAIYVRDVHRGRTRLVSVSSAGEASAGSAGVEGGQRTITIDGRFVVFQANADNFPGEPGVFDAYVRGPLH